MTQETRGGSSSPAAPIEAATCLTDEQALALVLRAIGPDEEKEVEGAWGPDTLNTVWFHAIAMPIVRAVESAVLASSPREAADTKRLDWIEQTERRGLELPEYVPSHGNPDTPWHLCIKGAWRYFPTLRECIDSAMGSAPPAAATVEVPEPAKLYAERNNMAVTRDWMVGWDACRNAWRTAPKSALAVERDAYKWGYEYLQSRMESIDRHGWAHDCDEEIEYRIRAALSTPTAQPDADKPTPLLDGEGWQVTQGEGHSGWGWYAHHEDYPEEGATFICAAVRPTERGDLPAIDRATVIRLAREAAASGDGSELSGDAVERFAQLVFLEAARPTPAAAAGVPPVKRFADPVWQEVLGTVNEFNEETDREVIQRFLSRAVVRVLAASGAPAGAPTKGEQQ